jgi:glucosamine--fructose-6-phosphate aminotransferase (isomerizing)
MNFDNIDLKWQNMLAGIRAQADFVRLSPHAVYADLKQQLNLSKAPEKVYLTGCGDSWYCGMAARLAFEAWAGIPAEAVQAMEFSRYLAQYAPQNSLVLAVSNSGRVARTIEAVVQANRRGLLTVAATSNLKEGISQEARHTIDLAYAERSFAPGTSSYMACLVVEYCLAVYLAVVNGRFSEQDALNRLNEISALAEPMRSTIAANLELMEGLAQKINLKDNPIVFTGAGPNYGTAFFSMAKIIEATRAPAVGQEMEEWAHEQFFTANERTFTFLIAPPGAARERAIEQMAAVRAMGSTCVAVCHPDDTEVLAGADFTAPVYGQADELLSPILYCVPAELLAFHLALANNTVMLGFDNPKIKEANWQQIFGSKVLRD